MKISMRRILLLTGILIGSAAVYGQIQDWPMHNCDRERTSWAASEDILKPPLQEAGILKVEGYNTKIYQNLTWYDNTLCVSIETDGENLFAMFDTQTNELLWTFSVPSSNDVPSFSAAQNDSLVLCGGFNGFGLFALDRLTGEQRWSRALPTLYTRSPILDDDRIYISAGLFHCLNLADGSDIWAKDAVSGVIPCVDDASCYICTSLYRLKSYNKMDGSDLWSRYNSNFSYIGSALYGDYLYTVTGDSVVAYEKSTGEVQWVYRALDCYFTMSDLGAIAVSEDVICVSIWENPVLNGRLLALNREDGTFMWQHDFDYHGLLDPVIANGVVYVVQAARQDLFGFDLETGEQIYKNSTYNFIGQPIVADHKMYVCAGLGAYGVVVLENVPNQVPAQDTQYPVAFTLNQNVPNPFNPETKIRYTLHQKGRVKLAIFNTEGQMVFSQNSGIEPAGEHSIVWSGQDMTGNALPSGVYLCRLNVNDAIQTIRMVLLK